MSRRRSYLLALFAVALPLAACTPPPTGGGATTTTTTADGWPGEICLDGAGTDASAPDLYFSGTPNVRGNAVISATFSGGNVVVSANGTCSGQPIAATTIVQAANATEATATCASLGAGTDPATAYSGSPWSLPSDAWACSETYLL